MGFDGSPENDKQIERAVNALSKSPSKFQIIDIVRSFAILAVVGFHAGLGTLTIKNQLLHFVFFKAFNGVYGVYMFFVVSGFLISRLIGSNPNGLFDPDFRQFYIRRIGRILPLLMLICAIGMISLFFIQAPAFSPDEFFKIPHSPFNPYFWISIATFWFNWYSISFIHEPGTFWAVLWSLSVEEQFYFFYPFALKLLRNDLNLKIFLGIFILLGPLSQWIGYTFFRANNVIEHNSFSGFGLIATGALLYLVTEKHRSFFLQHKKMCVYLCVVGAFGMIKIYLHRSYISDIWGNTFDPMLFGFGLFFFLLGALHLDWFESDRWKFIALNGKFSYGIYLYHTMVICLVYPFISSLNVFLYFSFIVVLVFIVGLISYRYFEVPMNLLIRKWLGIGEK